MKKRVMTREYASCACAASTCRSWRPHAHDAEGNSLVTRTLRQVVHVIGHGDEEVEEELAALLHFLLHRSTPLEGVARADDECEIVSS